MRMHEVHEYTTVHKYCTVLYRYLYETLLYGTLQ